ncbi:MAG: hypothetical protein IIB16_02635 [Chloroflexi bacterium]|nr:hypothetical protein [Chloroflexota bacterium]
MAEVPAPIESVEINIAESFPPQYFVAIKSGLPSGCAEFRGYDVSREGNTVNIEVTNLEPAPGQLIACTAIYGYHDTNINLGSDFTGGETYSVVVNGLVTETFVAQGGGTVGEDDGSQISAPAPIEAVAINLDSQAGHAELVVISGLPNMCYESGSASLLHGSDAIRVEVAMVRPADLSIACAERYRTVETSLALEMTIEPCESYSVVVNGERYSVQAIAPNVRCAGPDPIGQPLPGVRDYPTAVVPAPIESVVIISTRSLPPQYVVKIVSGLPSGCAEFNDYDVTREGDDIRISVTNLMPAPASQIMCTQIYGIHDTSVNVGSDFERGVKYSVLVNDHPAENFIGIGGPNTGETVVEIPIGAGREIDNGQLVLKFQEVTEDSRCPANVVCVWAGQAKVQIAVSYEGQDPALRELVLDSTGASNNSISLGDYQVQLVALNPYPGTPAGIDPSDYVATFSVSGKSSSDERPADPTATVRAEPVAKEPLAVILFADIVGGSDNSKDLYCAGTEWQFGDGIGVAMSASCLPWTAESSIQRHFEQSYTYGAPGTYEVTFTHGPVKATTVVEVK